MRVLFLNPVGTIGGAERVLLRCLSELVKETCVEPALLALDEGPLLEAAEQLGVPARAVVAPAAVSGLGDSAAKFGGGGLSKAWAGLQSGPAVLRFARQLRRAVRTLCPDLLHSNGIKTHLLGAIVRGRTPVVWHVHDFYGRRPLAAKLLRRATGGVRAAVAISNAVAEDVRRCLPGVPVETVPNTVDCGHFTPGVGDDGLLDRLSGMRPPPSPVVRIGLVATFAKWKGQDVFLRAVEGLTRRGLRGRFRAYVVGGPIYRTAAQWRPEELRALAREAGVTEDVGFVPFQSDTAEVYRSLDVVVHASREPEPFGLTIAEAMACGRAVVVSMAGGAAELFDPAAEAVGVLPGDAEALADALSRLIDDPERRSRLGEAARRRALRDSKPGLLGPRLAAVYRRSLFAAV